MDAKWGTRAGAAAFALGLSVVGPQAMGLAAADTTEASAASSAPEQAGSPTTRGATPGTARQRSASSRGAKQSASPPRAAAASGESTQETATGGGSASPQQSAGNAAAAATARANRQLPPSARAPMAVPAAETEDTATPTAAPATAPAALAAAPALDVITAGTGVFDGTRRSGLPQAPVADFLAGTVVLARRTSPRPAAVAAQQEAVSAPAAIDPDQHVLLIGVDGTNLSAILADPYNQAFFDLMDTGTTAAATMVGHTTISNPSWTGILTGVWSETAGVPNNVFTPWTYDTWPTLFNQLESADPSIATTSIGNWEVIAQIAGAGSKPADTIVFYPEINGSWLDTDDAVGARSIEAIQNTVAGTPSFQMTYFVGVDNTGHDTGGSGTPQYAEALRNVNDNIGAIMNAVNAWETANGEEWTVIVVTDHGQVPEAPLGLGLLAHGFQSPPETTVFVIADGPDFLDGAVNNTYSQVDVTPTALRLFGIDPQPYFAGKPLMDRSAKDYFPALPGQEALKNALGAAIDMYGYPDAMTELTLAVRTVAATVPYAIYTVVNSLVESLPDFLTLPIEFIGAVIYQLVNIPVQLIVRLTGVTGNSIFPPQWWPYNPVPGTQPVPPSSEVPAWA